MNRSHLSGLCALATLVAAGCASDFAGTYTGEAIESGSVKIAVVQTTDVAKNETPPHTHPGATVSVTKDGGGYLVKFGSCEMKGEGNGPSLVVAAKSPCDVKAATWEGKMPLSATLKFDEGRLEMDVTGTMKNDTSVIAYSWTFKGKK